MEFLHFTQLYKNENENEINDDSKNIHKCATLSLNAQFPYLLPTSQIQVRVGAFLEVIHFINAHFTVSEKNTFFQEDFNGKEDFLKKYGDTFLFINPENKVVGYFIGNQIDWSTYYFRSSLILPQYRGLKIYQEFTGYLIEKLIQENFNRVEVHVSPNNHTNIHIHNKMQFKLTGLLNSERWGSLIVFMKFLNEKNKTIFGNHFCAEDFSFNPKERSLL